MKLYTRADRCAEVFMNELQQLFFLLGRQRVPGLWFKAIAQEIRADDKSAQKKQPASKEASEGKK
jgi:hypothetical protein